MARLPRCFTHVGEIGDWSKIANPVTPLLNVVMSVVVAGNEFDQGGRQITRLFGTAPAQLVGNVFGDVARPALGGVEADDANRIAVLTV